jgi:hypothetical protein
MIAMTLFAKKKKIGSFTIVISRYLSRGKGKGKAISLQVWAGPEGSRRLRLSDFKKVGT